MFQEAFKEILKKEEIQFSQEGETIVVSKDNGWVFLNFLQTIQGYVRFENGGGVFLNSKATRFNPIFRNKVRIYLISYHNKTKGIPTMQDEHGTILIFEQ